MAQKQSRRLQAVLIVPATSGTENCRNRNSDEVNTADVLLVVVLLDGGSGSGDQSPDPGTRFTLRFGSTAAQFRVFESEESFFIIGKLSDVPSFEQIPLGYSGIAKEDRRAIANGYPPFYCHFIHMNSGVEVAHPIQSMRDIHRAGWILAIGFSCPISTTTPLRLYDKRQLPAYRGA